MLRARWLAAVVLVWACSGDDTHRQRATTPGSGGPGDAAPAEAAAAPEQAGALSDALVASYWKTPDERDGAAKFAAQDWAGAKTAFDQARAAEKDDTRAARIELMLGLCAEKLEDAEGAAAHFAFAHQHLPLLADYTAYHQVRALWLGHHMDEAMALAKQVAP